MTTLSRQTSANTGAKYAHTVRIDPRCHAAMKAFAAQAGKSVNLVYEEVIGAFVMGITEGTEGAETRQAHPGRCA